MAHPRNALASALDFGFQRDTPRQGNKYESISRQPPYRRMTRRRGTPPGRAHQGHPRQRSRVTPSTSRRLGALQLPVGWPVVVASPSPRQANRSPRSSSRSHPDPSTLSSVTHCPAGSSAALGTAPTVSSPTPPRACGRRPLRTICCQDSTTWTPRQWSVHGAGGCAAHEGSAAVDPPTRVRDSDPHCMR